MRYQSPKILPSPCLKFQKDGVKSHYACVWVKIEALRARNTTYLLLLQMQQLDCAYFAACVTAWSSISTASI